MQLTSMSKENLQEIDSLSRREMQVITLLADGQTKQGISQHLSIARTTVATHVRHIFQKLRVSNVHGAVGRAFRFGILSLD
jgi:ATP/maltotriose-dependent transcriptional regulator MalT